jgi:hypothetical protein
MKQKGKRHITLKPCLTIEPHAAQEVAAIGTILTDL